MAAAAMLLQRPAERTSLNLATLPRKSGSVAPKWDARLERSHIECELSDAAQREARAFMRETPPTITPADVAIDGRAVPALADEIEECRRRVECDERLVLLRPLAGLDFHQRRVLAWIVATLFGEPLIQNANGDRSIAVYARSEAKRVTDGARYHQTHEGGGPHTDNVSIVDLWEYLVFSCGRKAWIGGESILVSGLSVHEELQATPAVLEILQQPFWFEYRGISEHLFRAPIITYNDSGEPRFRYLRRYIESAHFRAGEPLTPEQMWALNALDAILELPRLQFRTIIDEGEILITYDSQVLHARTAFCDCLPGVPADGGEALRGPYRFFDRVWAQKRSAGDLS